MRAKFFPGILASLFVFFGSIPLAYATPTIYQDSIYIGNIWDTEGQYDDGIPEQNSADSQGVFVCDSAMPTDGDQFTSFEFAGQMSSTAQVNMVFYANNGSGGIGSVIGQKVYYASDIGHSLTVPYSNVYGMSFTIQDLNPSTTGGEIWIPKTWSTDSNVSSSGEIDWATPPWVGTTGGSSTVTVTTTTSTTDVTTNVGVTVILPPPDWQQLVNDFINSVPDIPPPPPGSDQITAPSLSDPTTTMYPPTLPPATTDDMTVPPVSTPDPPPESSTPNYDFTSGYSDISVPTTDSQSFGITDPLSLPHDDSLPIPGDAPPGLTPTPGTGPTPIPSTTSPPSGSAPLPSGTSYTGTSGPTPSGSGGTLPVPSGGSTSTSGPGYSGTGGTAPDYTYGG